MALAYASAKLRGDRDIVLAAVKQDGDALEYASEAQREDPGGLVQVILGGMAGRALFAGASSPRHSQRPRALRSLGSALRVFNERWLASRWIWPAALRTCRVAAQRWARASGNFSRSFQWKRGKDRAGARRVSVLLGDRGRRAASAPSTRTVIKTGGPAGILRGPAFRD